MSRYVPFERDLLPFMSEILVLAKLAYQNSPVSPLERYISIYKACPESFTVLFDNQEGRIAAYIIAIPIEDTLYDFTKRDEYTEEQLTTDQIRPFSKGSNYITFFSIVTNPLSNDRVQILRSLSKLYVQKLKNFACNGVFVTKASAITWSQSGRKLCEGMSMIKTGENNFGSLYHNDKFYKVFVDAQTKDSIIKYFINKKQENKQDNTLMEEICKN